MPQRNYLTPRPADSVRQRWSFTGHSIRLWNIEHQTTLQHLHGHTAPVTDIALHSTRPLLASEDMTIRFWDLGAARLLALRRDHEWYTSSVAWKPDGSFWPARVWTKRSGSGIARHSSVCRALVTIPTGFAA